MKITIEPCSAEEYFQPIGITFPSPQKERGANVVVQEFVDLAASAPEAAMSEATPPSAPGMTASKAASTPPVKADSK